MNHDRAPFASPTTTRLLVARLGDLGGSSVLCTPDLDLAIELADVSNIVRASQGWLTLGEDFAPQVESFAGHVRRALVVARCSTQREIVAVASGVSHWLTVETVESVAGLLLLDG